MGQDQYFSMIEAVGVKGGSRLVPSHKRTRRHNAKNFAYRF